MQSLLFGFAGLLHFDNAVGLYGYGHAGFHASQELVAEEHNALLFNQLWYCPGTSTTRSVRAKVEQGWI